MTKHIAIIGAGQLGSRHLQALNLIDREISISIVDPNEASLTLTKDRFNETAQNPLISSVKYFPSLNDFKTEVDIAIIATNADVRSQVVEELLNENVKFILLEKVLFQQIKDYVKIGEILKEKKNHAWVNCSRRMWPFYQKLREDCGGSRLLEVNVCGSMWGMASNSIHFIDLISFLNGGTEFKLTTENLDKNILNSEKKGFLEFSGSINGIFKGGCRFSISSFSFDHVPLNLRIVSDLLIVNIFEGSDSGKAWISKKENDWQWEEISFQIPYQSQLTHLTVQKILDTGNCELTPYSESSLLHQPIISSFLSHLNNTNKGCIKRCPIT